MRGFSTTSLILGVLVAVGIGIFVFQRLHGKFSLPKGETKVVASATPTNNLGSNNTIFETNGVKHSIPLDEILSGGPPKDGIPSIDHPKFVDAKDATYLVDDNPGIGIVVKNEARFYPYRILVWHEITNDTIQGEVLAVTYCPLCATGIVYERKIDGREVTFGVSGKLYKSNLLMYDREGDESQESLWSQVLGEAVVGPQTGKKLAIVPSEITRWDAWKKVYPDTKALSKDTGLARDYDRDPYGDYYTSKDFIFGTGFTDTRLHPKAHVYGIQMNGVYAAFWEEAVKREGKIEKTIGGRNVIAEWHPDTESVSMSVPTIPVFWFSWLAVHPNTELVK